VTRSSAAASRRWDLGGTSLEDIVDSIRTEAFVYPDEARVVCGHGPATDIGTERATNPFSANHGRVDSRGA